ncbi:hypothetical protein Bhyg_08226 [Pseudolycoriella hygida]|uniref:Uncharacterized protein n=1 Tax=Pseudolycoriella hygida TaxID=35572 RepID=A0A9Q0N465_9DIPT|nr:hypothetical protein Bhyg_08226 [Pseudolycoriella hygida]
MVKSIKPKENFSEFAKEFWKKYEKKMFVEIVANIPTFLDFKVNVRNLQQYKNIYFYSIYSLEIRGVSNNELEEKMCLQYINLIACAANNIDLLKAFTAAEYFIHRIPITLHSQFIKPVFKNIDLKQFLWTKKDMSEFLKFIIVLVKMESLASTPKFHYAKKALDIFVNKLISTDEKESGWTNYLSKTLETLESGKDFDGLELLKLLSKPMLIEDKLKTDVAIMVSLMIGGSASLVGKRSALFVQNMLSIITLMYNIMKGSRISYYEHNVVGFFNNNCCNKLHTHIGLALLVSIRNIFLEALRCENINEVVVSFFSSYLIAEGSLLETSNCKRRADAVTSMSEMALTISRQISKVERICGLTRSITTLHRILMTPMLKCSTFQSIQKQMENEFLSRINPMQKIDFYTIVFMRSTSTKSKIYWLQQIRNIQKHEKTTNVKSVVYIVGQMNHSAFATNYDPLDVTLFEIKNFIDYPHVNVGIMEKIITDISGMDFYKADEDLKVNLLKSGICYLRKVMFDQSHRRIKKSSETLDEIAELNNEIEIVKQLIESLNYLKTFINCGLLDAQKEVCKLMTITLMQKIGESLLGRQYTDLAVEAFMMFYDFAKKGNDPLQEAYAIGYLIENVKLVPNKIVPEIVARIQTIIMSKLRTIGSMDRTALNNFLISFLQLTMYTARYQQNLQHAKKYMRAIQKLLTKYDPKKNELMTPNVKYAEVMFELVAMDSESHITPILFMEDIFFRLKRPKKIRDSDDETMSCTLFGLASTIYSYFLTRHPCELDESLISIIFRASRDRGFSCLFAKNSILQCNVYLTCHTKDIKFEKLHGLMNHLDRALGCKNSVIEKEVRR